MLKEYQFGLRVDETERDKLRRLARRWRCTPSEAVRMLIQTANEYSRPMTVFVEADRERQMETAGQ